MLATFRSCGSVRLPVAARGLSIEAREANNVVGTYTANGVRTRPGLVFVRGEGSWLFDDADDKYLDMASGIAVSVLGHADPEWVAAIADQAGRVAHTSNLFHNFPSTTLAEKLVATSGFDKVFLCNSGTEANEAALKFAYKFRQAAVGMPATPEFSCLSDSSVECRTEGGRCWCWPERSVPSRVVAFKQSFHGRSMGALAMTHKPAIRYPFAPLPHDVTFLPFNDADAVRQVFEAHPGGIDAVIVEPVQGEAGVFPATEDFLGAIREQCTKHSAVMICDEVQCGLGRTGALWAHERYGVEPDVVTAAKPLAGGIPIGATLLTDRIADVVAPGDHGTTFGGNPIACAAANVVLDRISAPDFLPAVVDKGHALKGYLSEALGPGVLAVRQSGLLAGIQMADGAAAAAVTQKALARGVVAITAGVGVVRLAPPLNISGADLEHGATVVAECAREVGAGGLE